jgi:hypothetical protein
MFAPLAARTQQRFHALCCQALRFERMSPDSKNSPSSLLKMTGGCIISLHIPRNFKPPVLPIVLRHPAMPSAPMPETSIHKDNQAFAAKNEVGFAKQLLVSLPARDSIRPKDGNQF